MQEWKCKECLTITFDGVEFEYEYYCVDCWEEDIVEDIT